MLTLFPRIRPNPSPPPDPPEASTPVLAITDSAPANESARCDAGAVSENSAEATAASPSSSLETGQGIVATATIIEDSGLLESELAPAEVPSSDPELSVLVAGLAVAGAEPFVVEITDEWTSPEPQDVAALSPSSRTEDAAAESTAAPTIPDNPRASSEDAPKDGKEPSTEMLAESAIPETDDLTAAQQGDIEPETKARPEVPTTSTENVSAELWVAGTNIFDELDILHEAATASVLLPATESAPEVLEAEPPEPMAEISSDSAHSVVAQQQSKESQPLNDDSTVVAEGDPSTSPDMPASAAPVIEEPVGEMTVVNLRVVSSEEPRPAEQAMVAETMLTEGVRVLDAVMPETPSPVAIAEQEAPPERATGLAEAREETINAETSAQTLAVSTAEALSATPHPTLHGIPPKPKHAEGRFFELARVPEPESMDDAVEVEAYASAAAQAHLDAIDDTFVAHAQLLLRGRERGRALDIGTGPGQIVIKLASKLTRWKFVGVDRSASMIDRAREVQGGVPEVAGRIEFRVADGNSLDFPDSTFDLIVCNSVLHHMAEPQNLFSEIARVVKPGGAILLRDLRRPARFEYGSHIRKHGKHYSGEMRRLYVASVQAAYTEEELRKMVAESKLRDVRVFTHGKTHIGFERPLAELAPQKSKSKAAP
jgi:ubiquinone/menaquinone biosynthesis C-methylase UbiE